MPNGSEEARINGSDITMIADKGFGADDDCLVITESWMHYFIPLHRNTAEGIRHCMGTRLTSDNKVCFSTRASRTATRSQAATTCYRLCIRAAMLSCLRKKNSDAKGKLTDEHIATMQCVAVAKNATRLAFRYSKPTGLTSTKLRSTPLQGTAGN